MERKSFDLMCFGEIMLRLSPPANERLVRGELLEKRAGGAELNVASGVSLLGLRTGMLSRLPRNALGTFIKNRIRFLGVSDDYLVYDDSYEARLGVYYYENGAYPRKPSIVYDRKNSSINRITLDEIPETIYTDTRIFHTSGISLALSENAREVSTELIRRFKAGGARISFDVNYRANLWSEDDARNAIERILPYVDILFVSEETIRRMFRKTGDLRDILRSYCEQYGVRIVASTQRTVISPKQHSFTSLLYDRAADAFFTEPPYENIDVVDRLGSGDDYVAGVLYGLLRTGDPAKALQFGNAASAVKNTIPGDLPSSDLAEITAIIRSHQSTGPQSEMNR